MQASVSVFPSSHPSPRSTLPLPQTGTTHPPPTHSPAPSAHAVPSVTRGQPCDSSDGAPSTQRPPEQVEALTVRVCRPASAHSSAASQTPQSPATGVQSVSVAH